MRKEAFKFDFLMIICLLVTIVIVIVSAVYSAFKPSSIINTDDTVRTVDYSEGWITANGVRVRINEFSINDANLSVYRPLVLTKKIENIKNGEMLFIQSRNLVINIYIDNDLIYKTAENGKIANISGFDNYIYTDIPFSSNGKTLKLEIFKTEYSLGLSASRVLLGSGIVIKNDIMRESVVPLILGELFLFLGVTLILLGVFTRKKLQNYLSAIFFGIFLIFMSFTIVLDTAWAYSMIKNTVFLENVSKICLAACIPAFVAFIDTFYTVEHYYPLKILVVLTSFAVIVFYLLEALNIVPGASLGLVIQVLLTLSGIVVTVEMFIFMMRLHWQNLPRKQIYYIAAFVFIICTVFDIGMYYGWPAGSNNMTLTCAGLVFLTVTTVIALFEEVFEMIKLGIQAGKIGKIAFTDANTGIGNVAAFKAKFDDLEARKASFKFIGIIQFDVNNLKVINDSKGHEAGDLLIKTAANIINQAFGFAGTCYRTGGDEFVAIITGDHAPIVCEEAIYKFNKLIDKFNADPNKPFDLRIAHGVAYYQNDKTENMTLKEVHKMADERMYSNKKMLKARFARSAEEQVIR